MTKKKQAQRTLWIARASHAVKEAGGHEGKIDWDTATHLYNTGVAPEEAGKQLAELQHGSDPVKRKHGHAGYDWRSNDP